MKPMAALKSAKSALAAGVVAVTLLVVGCAPGPGWENPNLSRDHWSSDIASCQRRAANLVEKEELRSNSFGNSILSKGDEFAAQMDTVQRLKRQKALSGSCMQGRGYRQGTTPIVN
jgi:hypothetical protein